VGRWEQGETGRTRGEQRGTGEERGRSERLVVGDDEPDNAEGYRSNQINAESIR